MGDWERHKVVQYKSITTTDTGKDTTGRDYWGIWVTGRDIRWHNTEL